MATRLKEGKVVELDSQPRQMTFTRVAHLVVVLHDGPLPRAGIDPGNKVLHVSCDQHGRVGDWCSADSHMTLLDRADGLSV